MGDPKRIRKKYERPKHLWQRARLEEDTLLKKEYGCKNMTEVWKVKAKLRRFRKQARKLIGAMGEQAEKEKEQLIAKLQRLGLLTPEKNSLDDVLALTVRDLMERRLQTLVFRKGLARSIKEARQLITHGHIAIGDKKIFSPNYLVLKEEEDKIRKI
ncbi:MAG: 30S ribosomal protein S4 [Candidatus Nanoarchaeia archaeon]|nr:30S ribosomal protein S4 [Candidatus Haiyanarchaeum thermophilum]MCW1303134.1 30S ribosomal protein S4 [Candidatus Haiyanarchaeum thermophilum]MCW1303799.1 30S ribosomal protein S4 [Candidatus Haiyanarchaeum thermophilum]MCW1306586.1 30S ribosomal protein S4 [Candidatus Haiyanarchaeum thermophilum]MCW1306998.1 30S ribosomal protein S4 [Candidatus Haiyanarchaeum thermophilum]